MQVLALEPVATVIVLTELLKPKPGAEIVSVIVVVAVAAPEVPVITTG
jgi:hypothetical protein